MDKIFLEMLADSAQEFDQQKKEIATKSDTGFLTVKVDVDCKLFCDGDFSDLVEANKVKKIPIEVGQHLITIESENMEDVSEDREVDIKESGKNYLLVIKDLHEKEKKASQLAVEKRLAEEQKRKTAELKVKEEEEQRKKDEYLSNTDFVAKYYDNSKDKVSIKDHDLETIKTTEIVPALKKGNASAAFIHALILMEQYPEYLGGVSRPEQQESEIVNSLNYAANKNITEAQYWLGLKLLFSNRDVALNYLRAAAEKGNPNAQYRLGTELLNEDNDEAEMWSLKALKNGCMDAIYNFDILSDTRDLPPVFLSELERIADTGNAKANYHLYSIYCYGHLNGLCEDDNYVDVHDLNWDLGIKHLKRSADLGYSFAQFELGKLFEEGVIPDNDDDWGLQNIDEAKKWYKKAAEQGNQEASKRLKEI